MDYCSGALNIIQLTENELRESQKFKNYEDFLVTIENKYGFRLKDCYWMTTPTLEIFQYENGVLV